METKRRCRCCYSKEPLDNLVRCVEGSHKNYLDILNETFDITVMESEEWRLCSVCCVRLREASSFRALVLRSEARYRNRREARDNCCDAVVKVEVTELASPTFDDFFDNGEFSEEDDKPLKCVKERALVKKTASVSETALENDHTADVMEFEELKSIISGKQAPKINMNRLYQVNKYVRELVAKEGDDFVLPALSHAMVSVRACAKSLVTEYRRENARILLPLRVPKFQRAPRKTRSARLAKAPKTVDTMAKERLSSEKRAIRKSIIHNALLILQNTTATPFIYFHSNFKCFYCRQTFFEFHLMKTHCVETHVDIKTDARKVRAFRDILMVDISDLKCRKCGENFDSIEDIKQHLILAHEVPINEKHKDDIMGFKLNSDNFNCHLCGEEFHVFRNLSLHVNKHYANYMCDVCGKPFISYERYRNHEVTHLAGVFKCAKCDQAFPTMKTRAAHYVAEHRNLRYGCPLCCERFEKYLERTQHLSAAHSVTYTFKCPHCAKQFYHKPHMRAHIQNMHRPREKKVECKECGMRFTDNNALSRHTISHTGEKRFVCRLCGKRYGRKYSLGEHMRAHSHRHAYQ